jgi:DNA-binding NtrC family response regulator
MPTRILVVDDAPSVRLMLAQLLGNAGYEVLSAATFEEGRQLADAENPDLLLVDIRLNQFNGLQLAVRSRVDHPSRPVIVMTGHADPVLEAEARRHGAEFVEKPLQPSRLIELIQRMAPAQDGDGAR